MSTSRKRFIRRVPKTPARDLNTTRAMCRTSRTKNGDSFSHVSTLPRHHRPRGHGTRSWPRRRGHADAARARARTSLSLFFETECSQGVSRLLSRKVGSPGKRRPAPGVVEHRGRRRHREPEAVLQRLSEIMTIHSGLEEHGVLGGLISHRSHVQIVHPLSSLPIGKVGHVT